MSSFAPKLAKLLREWLPELKGRAMAVSEADPFNPDTMPTLPLAIVATLGETYTVAPEPEITATFQVEIMLPPRRYNKDDGTPSPFWAYYDYTSIRDRIIEGLQTQGRSNLTALSIESDPAAVVLSFTVQRVSRWCPPTPEESCGPDLSSTGAILTAKVLPKAYYYDHPEEGENA